MERERPSCFSSRIERVRRCNSLESFRLKGKIETLEAQRAIQHFIISREQTVVRKELNKIFELKKPPETSAERRRLLGKRAQASTVSAEANRVNEVWCVNGKDAVHGRTPSEPAAGSVGVGAQLPTLPVRRRAIVSLTRERLRELDSNYAEETFKGPKSPDPGWKQFPKNVCEASSASVLSLPKPRTQTYSSSRQPQRTNIEGDSSTTVPTSGHGTLSDELKHVPTYWVRGLSVSVCMAELQIRKKGKADLEID